MEVVGQVVGVVVGVIVAFSPGAAVVASLHCTRDLRENGRSNLMAVTPIFRGEQERGENGEREGRRRG